MRVLVLLFLFTTVAHSQVPSYELHLSDALIKAKHKSEKLKSAKAETRSAQEQADASSSTLLPRLSLDGNLHYLSTVPTLQVVPNGPSVQLGAHLNYSIGPTLSYVLWDGGASSKLHKSQEKISEARRQDERTQTAHVLADVRIAYVRTQLGLEQLHFLSDALKLAQSQSKDISNRKKEGSASDLEFLSAKKEVLSYELLFKQKQADLASSLRDLITLVEDTQNLNIKEPAPKGFANASLWLTLDSIEQTMKEESVDEPSSLSELPPQVRSQELLAESLDLLAKSQDASLYPRLQISARTSLDYPNGPILQRIHQNTLSLGFSMPLYEFSKIRHLAAEKAMQAESARHRRNQIASDMQRDFAKAKEMLRSLREQNLNSQEILKQSEKLAKMNYEAYRFGRITLVEVQVANLRALQAKVDLSHIHAQILYQLTNLKTLAAKDEAP